MLSNVQSLRNKLSEIQNIADTHELDCLLLTETWVTVDHHLVELKLKGYQQPLCHIREHGGVMIYIKEGISHKQVNTRTACNDAVWVEIMNNTLPTIIGCIYRSPSSSSDNNLNMIKMFQEIYDSHNSKNIVITGDLNLPHIDWPAGTGSSPTERAFIDVWEDMHLDQMVTKHTRYRQNQEPSLLDIILTSFPESISTPKHMPALGNSDHECIHFEVELAKRSTSEPPKLDYYRVNDDNFRFYLETTNWYEMICDQTLDMDTVGENFSRHIDEIMNNTIPLTVHKARNKPWFSTSLKRLYRKKERTWKKVQEHGTEEHWTAFKEARRAFNAHKEKQIFSYEENIIRGKQKNQKRYYKYLSSKNPFPKNEMTLKNDDHTETDPLACGNILKEVFRKSFTDPEKTKVVPQGLRRRAAELRDFAFTMKDVELRLRKLKTPKSPGLDRVSNVLLKKFAYEFSYPLFLLFKRMYKTGTIPKCYKEAIVIPIFKKGNKQDPTNFRPVSLTSCIMKVFEKLMLEVMKKFINEQNLISHHQHGFCSSKSTTTNLLNFWHEVSSLADARSQFSIIYTDMSKAFDKIPHRYLIAKLDAYGFRGTVLELLSSYLKDRTQRVSVKGVLSDPMKVTSGTPQGGVLSGILFALFVDDLPEVIQHAQVFLYADDVKLLMSVNSSEEALDLQTDLSAQARWCDTWGLPMNPAKCEFIHYSPRNCTNVLNPEYSIMNTPLSRVSEVKDLGITISDNLKFNTHIDKICKNTNSEIGRARRSFHCRKPEFLSDLYMTYIRPRMEYGTQVWNPIHATLIDKLEKVQNRFTRLLPNGKNLSHDERNEILDITTHEDRRRRGDMVLTWEILNDENHPCRHLLTLDTGKTIRCHSKKLTKKRFANDISKQSFTHRITNCWNNLDDDVVSSESQNIFKRRYDSSV